MFFATVEYGHDSKEDALACMKLVWKKLKEDAQVHRPRVSVSWIKPVYQNRK